MLNTPDRRVLVRSRMPKGAWGSRPQLWIITGLVLVVIGIAALILAPRYAGAALGPATAAFVMAIYTAVQAKRLTRDRQR